MPSWTDVEQFLVTGLSLGGVYALSGVGMVVLYRATGVLNLAFGAVGAMGALIAWQLINHAGFGFWPAFAVSVLFGGVVTLAYGMVFGPALAFRDPLVKATATLGYDGSTVHIPAIRRPAVATTDPAFFRYSVIVAILMFLLVLVHIRSRPGRAWAAIRQSESAALAAGINTTFYKLWAFALASFITGVAGGLVAGSFRYLNSLTFSTQDSITLLAVVLMGGAYSLWGAIVAAILLKFLAALLNDWGVSPDWLTILFGIGVLQVLTTAPRGLVDQVPKDLARLGRLVHGLFSRGSPAPEKTS